MNKDPISVTTEQIWRQLSNRLRRFVRSRISSDADVEDVLQSVFLRIHTKLDSLRNEQRLESWVFQIARNAVTDHYRARVKQHDDVGTFVEPEMTNDGNANSDIASCLRVLIDRLPDDQKSALSMYELQGIAQKDIAKHESISLSGVKSRIQRGRKSLEAMLRACCEFQLDGRGNVVEYEPNDQNCCDGTCE